MFNLNKNTNEKNYQYTDFADNAAKAEAETLPKPEAVAEAKAETLPAVNIEQTKAAAAEHVDTAKFQFGRMESNLGNRSNVIGKKAESLGAHKAAGMSFEGAGFGNLSLKRPETVAELKSNTAERENTARDAVGGATEAAHEAANSNSAEGLDAAAGPAKNGVESLRELGNGNIDDIDRILILLLTELIKMRAERMEREIAEMDEDIAFHEATAENHQREAESLKERQERIRAKKDLFTSSLDLAA